jgi:predicted metalloprotease
MRWTPGGESSNIEDRRGQRLSIGGRGLGLGGAAVVLILSLIFGHNFFNDIGAASGPETTTASGDVGPVKETPAEHRLVQFVSFVLDDAQSTWRQILPKYGADYHDAKLVLFRDAVESGCGVAQTAMGPFYCPVDQKVYLDLGFFEELQNRFGANGDFAQAYVIAHELGHHVQHILGTDARVRQLEESRPGLANQLSVRLELQADCYAGVWGHSTGERRILEQGDVEEGLGAAAAVGDDRIQRAETGSVHPESFTHGTSAQRVGWFRRGLDSGDPQSCDTFGTNRL